MKLSPGDIVLMLDSPGCYKSWVGKTFRINRYYGDITNGTKLVHSDCWLIIGHQAARFELLAPESCLQLIKSHAVDGSVVTAYANSQPKISYAPQSTPPKGNIA